MQVIGAGIGGLTCAALLAQVRYNNDKHAVKIAGLTS